MIVRSDPIWSPGFALTEYFQTSRLLIGRWLCDGTREDTGADETANHYEIWLQRVGSHSVEAAGQRVLADPLTAIFHDRGQQLRARSIPHVQQESIVVLLSETAAIDLLSTPETGPRAGFPHLAARVDPRAALLIFRLQRLLYNRQAGPDLEIEESVLALTQHLLSGADPLQARVATDGRSTRTRRAHREIVEAVQLFLVQNLTEPILIEDIARAVAVSPYHLSRLYSLETGISIHRYLTRLRLRTALERLAGGDADLSRIALEIGFSSHSHFTTAFRREFGESPSHLTTRLPHIVGPCATACSS